MTMMMCLLFDCEMNADAIDDLCQATETNEPARLVYKFPNTRASSVRTIMIARRALGTSRSIDSSSSRELAADSCCRDSLASGDSGTDQLLIFTKGSQTYTPHQVGIKRMPSSASELLSQQSAHDDDIETQDFGQNEDDAVDDKVDETIELHGHIIGMNLSPDHR